VFKRRVVVLLLLVFTLLLSGCGQSNFLSAVTIRPGTISPNADGVDDIAELKYTLTRQSSVTIYLLDAAGQRHFLRTDKRRSPGPRTTYVSGVVDGSLLPDGTYTVTIVAVDDRGRQQTQTVPLTLKGGDPVRIEIQNLSVFPTEFTPNRDGITDRVKICYNLNKQASRIDVYVLDAKGNKYPVPEDKIREVGSPGPHEHDYDGGIDLGATPPPDGDYTVVVEAEDAVGNLARAEAKITIKSGGVPRIEIVNAAAVFSPLVVPLGGTLTFTCTVKNVGAVPIRTKGPESGTVYTTTENFNTLGQYEEPGIFRIGLDFEGNSAGRAYPFRWQLGLDSELTVLDTDIGPQKYLMPGQSVTVVGHLVIVDRPPKVQPYYWIGLIEEQVQMIQDRVQATPISIGY
jgi:major membrane immunogen (membrane-anchored lipoprotein)